jgi:hypothetical protein
MAVSPNPAVRQQATEYLQNVQQQVMRANIQSRAKAAERAAGASDPIKWEYRQGPGNSVIAFHPNDPSKKFIADKGDLSEKQAERQDKIFAQEGKLRDDFTKATKEFDTVQWGYGRIAAAIEDRVANPDVESPASDIALVFGFMKVLDPDSVVKETEAATVQNATGVPDQVRNMWNRVLKGERLNDEQRNDIVKTAGRLYGRAHTQAEKVAGRVRKLATSYGLDPDRTVPAFEKMSVPQIRRKWTDPPPRAAPLVTEPTVIDTSGNKKVRISPWGAP